MYLEKTTAATDYPVTVDELKEHVVDSGSMSPGELTLAIAAATAFVESYTERSMLVQTFKLWLEEFPVKDYIELPVSPLDSVVSVHYADSAGADTVFSSANYFADKIATPGRVLLKNNIAWPNALYRGLSGYAGYVEFKAGLAAGNIPADLKLALRQLAAHNLEHREPLTDATLAEMPFSLRAILDNYRVKTF